MSTSLKVIVEKHSDGYVAYPIGRLYGTLGLFSEYRVTYRPSHSAVAPVG